MSKVYMLAATAFYLAVGSAAYAADLPIKARPAPTVAPPAAYNWTGCYLGANGGYAWGKSSHSVNFDDINTVPEFLFTDDLSTNGGIFGLHGGCNYQTGNFVFGIEGDYSWMNASKSISYTFSGAGDNDSAAFTTKLKNLASVRGRVGLVGLAENRALLYATGGFAWARFSYDFNLNDNGPVSAASLSFSPNGAVLGGGVEYAVWENIILRLEYLHYWFNKGYLLPTTAVIGPAPGDSVTLKSADEIRFGVSYLFNGR
jgi:outer membrane immunogenic protein